MIVRVLGFGKDDPADSNVDPNAHISMKQTVTAIAGSGYIINMGDSANNPTTATMLPNGSSTHDTLSMESKVTPKEFSKTEKIKCMCKYCIMAWYCDLCVHSGMLGVYVPPSFSLRVDYPLGSLWDKHHVGATIRAI
jgi:hypothetical protein